MTYQEKGDELRKIFTQKSENFISAEKAISSFFGWGDSTELTEFINAKMEFEVAGNEYHDFLVFVKENNISGEQEYKE